MKKVVVFLIISSLLLTGCSIKKVNELSDKEKFAKEYNISKDNCFVYSNYEEILELLENGTGIVLFANSDEETSLKAVEIIHKVAKKNNIKKIYYFNPKTLKDKQSKKYKKLLSDLEKEISNYSLQLPTLYAIQDGKIVNYSNSFSNKNELSEDYLTKKRLKKIEEKYLSIFHYEEE